MEKKTDLQHNKVHHLEDTMIMYGVYNSDTLRYIYILYLYYIYIRYIIYILYIPLPITTVPSFISTIIY